MKKNINKNPIGSFRKKATIKPSQKKKRNHPEISSPDHKNLQENITDSAVAIPISSISHHRKIKRDITSSSLEIIIAEDNEVSFFILKAQLEKLNANIHYAKNGLEAVVMVKTIPEVDLILLDVKMPVMDGIEAIRKIREIAPDIPVIAQSAFADNIDVLSLYQAGCDDFISKPIDQNLLLSKITFWNF